MTQKYTAIGKIKALRLEAAKFATFHDTYDSKYANDSHCDKKGYGFGRDDRFSGFFLKTSFDSWAGYYGSSSCGTIFHAYHTDLLNDYLVKALNVHQRELFATVAKLMLDDAAALVSAAEQEILEQQRLLAEATADVQASEAA